MKKNGLLITFCFYLLVANSLIAQIPPQAFNYSAVARGTQGQPIANQNIGIRFSILKSSVNGAVQYVEKHQTTTDPYGLFNLKIGGGAVQSGSFSSINWGADSYFLKVELDVQGGINYFHMGTTQFISVPYALHSATTDSIAGVNLFNGNYNDLTNQPITIDSLSSNGDTLYLSNGSTYFNSNNNTNAHYVGEQFGGGVIFHLWKDNAGIEHGLIVDLVDLDTTMVWSNIDSLWIGPSAQSSFDGLSNSNAIVSQPGHTNSAAAVCLNSNSGGYTDWYLPSILELQLLWQNYYTVSKVLNQISGATRLSLSRYWSSSELDIVNWYNSNQGTIFLTTLVYYFSFDLTATSDIISKVVNGSSGYNVRAIRAF